MKRLYITVGNRVAEEGVRPEDRGEFLVIDWEAKKILETHITDSGKEVKIGRSRGASGLTWHEDKIYVATREGLFCADPDSYDVTFVAEQIMGGVHQIRSDGHTLWVTHHGQDCITLNRDDKVQAVLCLTKESFTEKNPSILGINAIGVSPNKEIFLMYSHLGQIFNWTKQKVVVSGLEHSPHDLEFVNEKEILFTQSSKRELWKADVTNGRKSMVFSLPPTEDPEPSYAIPDFVRGVACDENCNSVFLLSAPGTIIELDDYSWEIKDTFEFCDTPGASPFDIILDPRDL